MAWKNMPNWNNLKVWKNDTPWAGNNLPWERDPKGKSEAELVVIEGQRESEADTTAKRSADKPKKAAAKKSTK